MLIFTKGNSKLMFCIGIIMLMLVVRDIVGIEIFDKLVVVVTIISMLCLNYEKLVYLVFFMFPLMCGVPGYLMTFAYIILVFKGPKLRSQQIVPLVIVALLEVINESFRNVDGLYVGILSFLSFTAIFFYFLDELNRKYSVKKCLIYYGVGAAFTLIVIYSNMLIEYGLNSILSGMLRNGALGVVDNDVTKMQGHLAMNANTIAYLSISVITIFSVLLIQTTTNRKTKWFYGCIIGVCLFSGLLSFSRTFVSVLALFIASLILTAKWKQKFKIINYLALLCAVIVYSYSDILLNMYDTFLGRIEDSNMATAGGRTVLFQLYNKAWLGNVSYIIFGAGVVSYWGTLKVYNAIHNGLQQIWVCLGIIGFLTYILRVSFYLFRCKEKRIIFYLPFFITLLIDQSIQFLAPYPLVLILLATLQMPQMINDDKR